MRLILNERTDNAAATVERLMREAAVTGAQARVTTLSGIADRRQGTEVRHYNGTVEKWDGEMGYLTLSFGEQGSLIKIDVLNVVDVELL